MKRRVTSMCTRLAWTSTPASSPTRVWKNSWLSRRVPPTRTMRSRSGIVPGAIAVPGSLRGTTTPLGIVKKLCAGPAKLTRHSSPGRMVIGDPPARSQPMPARQVGRDTLPSGVRKAISNAA